MKKIITILLVATFCVGIFAGCAPKDSSETSATTEAITQQEAPQGKEALNGKKVIFFGNSFTYYGKCVLAKGQSTFSQDLRTNDKGYFYRICKDNGVDVSVTNFTFGGHRLKDFFSGSCAADRGHNGHNHLENIVDRNYDYVILQEGSASAGVNELVDDVKSMMKIFQEVNPNTKFVFLVHHQVHINSYAWRSTIKELEEMGLIIVDWGKIVSDVLDGTTQVPGATEKYNKNSFIVNQSADDGFHENMLCGYITALMTYCAITGEKAEGQPLWFGDNDVNFGIPAIAAFRIKYYTHDPETNFDKILASEPDMTGFQKLIDQYLEEKAYRNY